MLSRIPHTNQKIITGQRTTSNYLKMQKAFGWFYLQNFFDILAEQDRNGRFLEIGSGPGYQTAEVAKRYPQARIIAVEPSADMIDIATAYLVQYDLSDRVQFIKGTVEDEALISGLGEFDLIYSTFSLHHWADPIQAFRNLYGALKQMGTLVIHDFRRDGFACRLPLPQGIAESIWSSYTPEEVKWILNQASIPGYRLRPGFPYLSIIINRQGETINSQTPNLIKRLGELEKGQVGLIVSVEANTSEHLQELQVMGISTGSVVRVIDNYIHHVVFNVDRKKFAADREIAAGIIVRTFPFNNDSFLPSSQRQIS